MSEIEEVKAMIREMMGQEMKNFQTAVAGGEEEATMSPGIYTMLQVLLAKIEQRFPECGTSGQEAPAVKVWHDASETPVASRTKIVLYTNDEWDMFRAHEAKDDYDNYWSRVNQCLNEKGVDVKSWAYADDLLDLTHPVTKTSDEEPVSEGLEEAKRRIASEYMEEVKRETGYKDYAYWNGLEKGIELGANWQNEKEQQRLHSDENIQALAGRYAYEEWDEDLVEVARDSFIDGYNICKQQMMKDAVVASVNTYEEVGGEGYVEFVANIPVGKYKKETLVKLIIIKEE